MSRTFASYFTKLADGSLEPSEIREAFREILSGAWTPVQVAGFAVALRFKGDDPDTIVSCALELRAAMTEVKHDYEILLDTCGTGGDGSRTLNISTAAAIVIAACGYPVAKHGNRSVSSQCGSADVVEALGISLEVLPERQCEVLREAGIAFLMAPAHHPALKHAAVARRELGVRTIFNALGPLANPARTTHQLVGVYSDSLRSIVARALGALGVKRAWVVRSEDGMDELSVSEATRVSEWNNGALVERRISPEDFGIPRGDPSSVAGGDAKANADAILALFSRANHPAKDTIVMNAGAALCVAGFSEDLKKCATRAREAIDSGASMEKLLAFRQSANQWKGP